MSDTAKKQKSQLDKFKEAARELQCDDDHYTFRKRLGQLVENKNHNEKDGSQDD